jgi:methylphosphotriester-DNA--protein-cysteine methyltransferase
MRMDLKLRNPYQGLIYQVDAGLDPPLLGCHHHDELELNLVIRGRITYLVDGQRWTMGRRSLVWLFPGQEHQLLHRSADARYFVAAITAGILNEAAASERYADLGDTNTPRFQNSEIGPEPFDLLRRHLESLTEDGPSAVVLNRELGFGFRSGFHYEHDDPARLNAGLRYLLLACWRYHRHGASSKPVTLHPAVQRAIAILDDQSGAVPLEHLATDGGVSMAYISRLFHRQVGMPMHQYRASRRLMRFWQVWSRTPRPRLLDAALSAGFGSYAQFHRVFRATHGCGPRQYVRTEATLEPAFNAPDPAPSGG